MMRARVTAVAALGALAAAAHAAPARAVEHEHHLGVGGGWSALVIDDKSTASIGGGGWAGYSYGLSDAFNVLAEGSVSLVALGEDRGEGIPATRPATVSGLSVGGSYVLDIIRWLPHLALLGGLYSFSGGSLQQAVLIPGFQIGAGLDYQFNRTWSAGIVYRQHMFLTNTTTYPSFSNVFARVEIAWGY